MEHRQRNMPTREHMTQIVNTGALTRGDVFCGVFTVTIPLYTIIGGTLIHLTGLSWESASASSMTCTGAIGGALCGTCVSCCIAECLKEE